MTEKRPTLQAVVAYADQLRDRADRILDPGKPGYDCYAKPYYPTTAAARKVYHDHLAQITRRDYDMLGADPDYEIDADSQKHEAAELAMATLAARAAMRERERTQDDQTANHSLKRLTRQRQRHKRDLEAQRLELTPGQRLDRALAGFATIAAPGAAQIGGDTPAGDPRSMPAHHGDPGGEAAYLARKAIQQIEELLDQARARDLNRAA